MELFQQVVTAAGDTSSTLDSPFTYLTGLGFPGIIIGLLITGQLRTKAEVERLVRDMDRKDEIIGEKDKQIEALQTGIVDKAIPALTRSTQVLEQLPKIERDTQTALTQAQGEVRQLAEKLEQLVITRESKK